MILVVRIISILKRLFLLQTQTGEVKEYDYEYYDDAKPASPFVNPHDPTHRQVRGWPSYSIQASVGITMLPTQTVMG
jgi:hypothetical protein